MGNEHPHLNRESFNFCPKWCIIPHDTDFIVYKINTNTKSIQTKMKRSKKYQKCEKDFLESCLKVFMCVWVCFGIHKKIHLMEFFV